MCEQLARRRSEAASAPADNYEFESSFAIHFSMIRRCPSVFAAITFVRRHHLDLREITAEWHLFVDTQPRLPTRDALSSKRNIIIQSKHLLSMWRQRQTGSPSVLVVVPREWRAAGSPGQAGARGVLLLARPRPPLEHLRRLPFTALWASDAKFQV